MSKKAQPKTTKADAANINDSGNVDDMFISSGAPAGTASAPDPVDVADRHNAAIARDASTPSGDNTPIDINTGDQVTSGFFMDLTKEVDFELIASGTRLVVSCTAAEAVVSGNGNPMLNLRVKAERVIATADMSKAPMYRNRSIRDRLMFIPPNEVTGSRGTIWRAKLAFKAFDVDWQPRVFRTQADFMDWLKERAEQFIGAVAEVVVGIDDGTSAGTKAAQVNPETGEPYPPKNTVAQYYPYNPTNTSSLRAGVSGDTDDLPF